MRTATYATSATDPYFSPLLHPKLKALPRTYITESGTDTLRDDARLMKEKLEAEGVQVRYDAYEGYPHYSWTFPSQHLAAHSKEFFGNMAEGIKWCLAG
jgi:versiconal hemiacetal acetate esterase